MFGLNKSAKKTRTKLIRVGKILLRKKVRKANAEERMDNKEGRAYYKRNKAKLRRQAKLRQQKIDRNPRLKAAQQLRQKVQRLIRSGKTPQEALRLAVKK